MAEMIPLDHADTVQGAPGEAVLLPVLQETLLTQQTMRTILQDIQARAASLADQHDGSPS